MIQTALSLSIAKFQTSKLYTKVNRCHLKIDVDNDIWHTCSSISVWDSRRGVGKTRDVKLTAIRPVSLSGAFILGPKLIHTVLHTSIFITYSL